MRTTSSKDERSEKEIKHGFEKLYISKNKILKLNNRMKNEIR